MAAEHRLTDIIDPCAEEADGIDEDAFVDSDYEPAWEPGVTPFVDL